jgi:hypothetical protein
LQRLVKVTIVPSGAVAPWCVFDRDTQDLTVWIHLREVIKVAVQGLSLLVALPFAAMAGFGRFSHGFHALAQLFALVPGLIGDYIRVAFYVLTLQKCALRSRISFGSFFAHSSVVVARGVYIGAYCVLGSCEIGEGTQIASHVQILSGRHQHHREADGYLQGAKEEDFSQVIIGEHCWIGAAALLWQTSARGPRLAREPSSRELCPVASLQSETLRVRAQQLHANR